MGYLLIALVIQDKHMTNLCLNIISPQIHIKILLLAILKLGEEYYVIPILMVSNM
jgi:hypothetical protein